MTAQIRTDETDNTARAQTPRDSVKRSFAKAVSWRVVGTLDTFLLSFVIITFLAPWFGFNLAEEGGNIVHTAGYIAIAEVITKLVIYSGHEQIWTRVPWGKNTAYGQMPETKARSVAKTATWRILASLDTMLLALFFTGDLLTAFSIGSFEVITKLFLYFFHERIWQRIRFGINDPVA